MLYFDNNATTRVDDRVRDAMLPFLGSEYANPSSPYGAGRRVAGAMFRARERVADLVGARPAEILFTSGGTESNNAAIRMGLGLRPGRRGIVVTAVEHASVLELAEGLSGEGSRVVVVPVEASGRPDMAAMEAAITEDTAVVSVMAANNETGTLLPVPEVALQARRAGALIHCDAVQAAGKIPVDVEDLGVDLLSVSSHKLHGPKGIGLLWIRRDLGVNPVQIGGGQEQGRRGGTENVPGVVGFGEAARLAVESLADVSGRVRELRDRMEQALVDGLSGTRVNGSREYRLPQTMNLWFPGADAGALVALLDLASVCCSTGSACAAGSDEPSHVLRALGLGRDRLRQSVRFSLSRMTTDAEVDAATAAVLDAVRQLREGGEAHGMRPGPMS